MPPTGTKEAPGSKTVQQQQGRFILEPPPAPDVNASNLGPVTRSWNKRPATGAITKVASAGNKKVAEEDNEEAEDLGSDLDIMNDSDEL
ncbi:hypothetical protein E2562_001374 [Oryza meyeriana var. granulata]|uniref:Uncharacterized protein n=1 Tax=Oryza meyeriana var. granulata TaxID=110450 RepID=A0A6G1DCK5_9ORYZ|nr:hypothetical protein E2562_001374 [Oryza meyeriana var. granulata]